MSGQSLDPKFVRREQCEFWNNAAPGWKQMFVTLDRREVDIAGSQTRSGQALAPGPFPHRKPAVILFQPPDSHALNIIRL